MLLTCSACNSHVLSHLTQHATNVQSQISAEQPQTDYMLDYAAASVLMPAKPWTNARSAISDTDSGVAKLAPVLEVLAGVPVALQPLLQHAWHTVQSDTDTASASLFNPPLRSIVSDALASRMAATSQRAPWQAHQPPQSQPACSSDIADGAGAALEACAQTSSPSASNEHAKRKKKSRRKHSARIDTSQLD